MAKTILISVEIKEDVDRRVLQNIVNSAVKEITTLLQYTSSESDDIYREIYGRGVNIKFEID